MVKRVGSVFWVEEHFYFVRFQLLCLSFCLGEVGSFFWLTPNPNAKEWSSRKGTWSACSKARIIAGTEPRNS